MPDDQIERRVGERQCLGVDLRRLDLEAEVVRGRLSRRSIPGEMSVAVARSITPGGAG